MLSCHSTGLDYILNFWGKLMGKQSWGQEIVALAKLCFGKNSKRIKSDYCLSHEIACRGGGRKGSKSENLRKLSEKTPEQSLSQFQGRRTRLICQRAETKHKGYKTHAAGHLQCESQKKALETSSGTAAWH